MRIRLKANTEMVAGPMGVIRAGQEAEVPENIGRAIVERGLAVAVAPPAAPAPKVQTAEAKPQKETAEAPAGKDRKKD
jgi:hypothetical protein